MKRSSGFSLGKLIFSILFNAAVLAVVFFLFSPFFEEIDDTQICMIAEGAFGVRDWHLIYVNVILGKLYVLLGSLFPMIRWHVILQYVFIYAGYVTSMYVISRHKRGLFVSVVAVLASFYEMYVSIQYTKTAAFVCVVAFILIFEVVRNSTANTNISDSFISKDDSNKKSELIILTIIAYVLVIYGSMLRPEAFFIAAVPTVSVGFLELARTKNIKKYLLLFVPMFAIVVGFKFADSYVYSMDKDWSSFMIYNRSRMELNDYRYDILDFNKYSEELKALDVSENDALAILTYQYGDDSVFSYSRFKEIRDAFGRKELGYKVFANLFENLVNEIPKSYTMITGAIGVFLVLISTIVTDRSKSSPGFIKDSRRKLFSMLGVFLCCSAAVIYFQYSGRYSHRLMGALVIPTIFIICYMIDSVYIKDNDSKIIFGGNKNDITVPTCIVLCLALIGLNGFLYTKNLQTYAKWYSENNSTILEIEKFSEDKNTLYVGDTFTFQNVYKYKVFDVYKEGSLSNFVTCGSWYLNSPITKRVTRNYGYENPFDAIKSGEEKVQLWDNNGIDCKTLFLSEHYDNVYKAELIDNRSDINVYRVVVSGEMQESDK